MPNNNLKWEKTDEIDIGFDLDFYNRISLVADYYSRKTSDLLFNKPIAQISGYSSLLSNIGSIRNRGFELTLNTQNIIRKQFTWSSAITFSLNRNKILALGQNNADIFFDGFDGRLRVHRVGESIGAFNGATRIGIWGTSEVTEAAKYGVIPGDRKYLDVNTDYKIDAKDESVIGNPFPKYEIGFNNTFNYKNWSLAVDIRIVEGADIFDMSMQFIGDRNHYGNTYTKFYRQAWTPENQNTMQPRVRANIEYWGKNDNQMVFDGSFIRGQNLELAYKLPKDICERLKFNSVKFFANLQNFFLIDSYHGFDPELSNWGNIQGVDFYNYPKSRTLNLGMDVSF